MKKNEEMNLVLPVLVGLEQGPDQQQGGADGTNQVCGAVPKARSAVFVAGVPMRLPVSLIPPATTNNVNTMRINGKKSSESVCQTSPATVARPNKLAAGSAKASAQAQAILPKRRSQMRGASKGSSASDSNSPTKGERPTKSDLASLKTLRVRPKAAWRRLEAHRSILVPHRWRALEFADFT